MTNSQLKELLSDMSLSEKAEQLVQLHGRFFGNNDVITGQEMEFIVPEETALRTGSVLSYHGAGKIRELQDRIMSGQPHKIPAVFMTDIIHGYKTIFPAPIAQGASFNPELTKKLSEAAAKEAAAAGVHVTFSPMVDLSRDARWGRCYESTGEDPWLNARFAENAVWGYQGKDIKEKGRLAACVKHFAGYGAVLSGRDYNVTELSERTFMDDYLVPYKAAVEAGVKLVMTAFNTVDRIPCSINKKLMRDILRDGMCFNGVLISDYAAIAEAVSHGAAGDYAEAAEKAMLAGVDIDMVSQCYINNLVPLVENGIIPEELVDEAVMRILILKNELGLFENPYKDGSEEDEKTIILCDEHKKLSRDAANESIVLLKNDGLLPLKAKGKKIAVIGSLADSKKIIGAWSLFAEKSHIITLKSAFDELYPDAEITYVLSDNICEEAVSTAKNADTVIAVLGEDDSFTGESASRADITLPKGQTELFNALYEANENICTVLYGGRPLVITEIAEKSKAVVMAWFPGTCGNYSIADIIFGKVNPSGRLSMSFPYSAGQLPVSYGRFNTGRPKDDSVKHFVQFVSNYLDVPNLPLYHFGYGLSYTEYEYSKVTLDKDVLNRGGSITASVTVKNKGSMDGMEAVQLYIRDKSASVVRPLRELRGLEKVHLSAGEEKTVSFIITEEMLRFYDINMEYKSEDGGFTLWIGPDCMTDNSEEFILTAD